MKRVLTIIMVALLALPMSAQVVRTGNRYMTDDHHVMHKKAFAAYMQEQAEANLAAKFKYGLKLTNVGWGLLSVGLATEISGLTCYYVAQNRRWAEPITIEGPNVNFPERNSMEIAGSLMSYAGLGVITASLICISFGYDYMHEAADMFSLLQSFKKSQAYLSITAGQNGLGLAINF